MKCRFQQERLIKFLNYALCDALVSLRQIVIILKFPKGMSYKTSTASVAVKGTLTTVSILLYIDIFE